MIIKYQLELDTSNDCKDFIRSFKKEIEFGMNLYYDLWREIFDSFNDYEKIKKICLDINLFNDNLSKKFNTLMKFNTKNDKIVLLYEQYLSNYVYDKTYAKYVTDRF